MITYYVIINGYGDVIIYERKINSLFRILSMHVFISSLAPG